MPSRVKIASKAAGIHLLASCLIAIIIALIVFWLWFPYPYREIVGGRELFLLIISVDVVCGPLLTFIIFNPKKPRRELFQDIGIITIIQLTALCYGLYTLSQARPVYTVFEVDRFRVITASDVIKEKLKPELGGLQNLPWTGPIIIGTRTANDGQDFIESLNLSLTGIDPSMRPDWWQPYANSKASALKKAKELEILRKKQPDKQALIDQAIIDSGLPEQFIVWLPLTSFRSQNWVVLLDSRTAELKSFTPIDGF